MSGIMFIVIVPCKEHEGKLKKTAANIEIETEKTIKNDEQTKFKKFGNKLRDSITNDSGDTMISKCLSTDCISGSDLNKSLFKSKSENNLVDDTKAELGCDNRGYLKTSWEELKQILKARRHKVTITSPKCGADLLTAFHPETPLEIILAEVLQRLKIVNAAWAYTKNNEFWQVIFSLESRDLCEETLQVLRTFGIGTRYDSSVSVIPCGLYYHQSNTAEQGIQEDSQNSRTKKTAWSRFASSVKARKQLDEILNCVRADAAITFDWIFMLCVAAFVAAIGLVENSSVVIVASMLISPLMGPITAGTLGTALKDRSLQNLGLQNELLGLFLTLNIGFVFGLCICAVDERYGIGDWPTNEMMSRCELRSLLIGGLVAIPSGAGVALAVLGDYTASLVGVAISASLLPPAVNAGVLWAMALVHKIFLEDEGRWAGVITSKRYSNNPAAELAILGTVSLCLTLVNIVCIFLSGVAVYKIKEVSPLNSRLIPWWKSRKSIFQSNKMNEKDEETFWKLPIYGDWYTKERPADSNKISELDQRITPDLVQSDTITYRRNRFGNGRTQLQNMCSLDKPLEDSLENNLTLDNRASQGAEMTMSDESDPQDSLQSDLNSNINDQKSMNFNGNPFERYTFKNTAFKEYMKNYQANLPKETNYPIIETSSNLTVDSKKYSLALSKKSYNV